MHDANDKLQLNQQKVYSWILSFLGMIMAVVLGAWIAQSGVETAVVLISVIIILGWGVLARNAWWVFFQPFITLGGVFYHGIKLKNHEIAICLCFFPLILSLATRWSNPIKGRERPPAAVHVLTLYLVLHAIGSIVYNKFIGLQGQGFVYRSYFSFLVPLIFFYAYYFYATSKYLYLNLSLIYWALFVKLILNIYSLKNGSGINYIPGINFILPGSGGVGDLRAVGADFGILSFCYAGFSKTRFRRFIHILVGIMAICTTPLGGGRSSIIFCIFGIGIYLYFIRRLYLILPVVFFTFLVAVAINADPDSIREFEPSARRALSGFILDRAKAEDLGQTKSSNDWHEKLLILGYTSWLQNPVTILVGRGVRPWNEAQWNTSYVNDPGQAQIDLAAAMGAFEAAFPTTLACLGGMSFFLCLVLMYQTLPGPLKQLKRQGIVSVETVMYFIAVKGCATFLCFGAFSAGGFPADAIYSSLLAKMIYDDIRYKEQIKLSTVKL